MRTHLPADVISRQAAANMVVAAVGLRCGQQLLGIRALLEAGCSVLAFDLARAFDDEPLADYDAQRWRGTRKSSPVSGRTGLRSRIVLVTIG